LRVLLLRARRSPHDRSTDSHLRRPPAPGGARADLRRQRGDSSSRTAFRSSGLPGDAWRCASRPLTLGLLPANRNRRYLFSRRRPLPRGHLPLAGGEVSTSSRRARDVWPGSAANYYCQVSASRLVLPTAKNVVGNSASRRRSNPPVTSGLHSAVPLLQMIPVVYFNYYPSALRNLHQLPLTASAPPD
jgi:hypothetical protein